jgi:biotin transporter BioY
MSVPFYQRAKFKIKVEIMNMHFVGNVKSACIGLQWLIFKSKCSCSMINVTMQPFLPTLIIHLHSMNIHEHAHKYNLEKEGFKNSIML